MKRFRTSSSPHSTPNNSVSRVMFSVVIALLPGIAVATYFFGIGVLINIVLACIAALGFEAIALALRGKPLKPFLTDGSAIVTAVLLGLAIPQLAPWWLIVVGMFFAIIIAKQLYGGVGQNIFNPAMVGYVVLLISFPKEMTSWVLPHAIWSDLSISDILNIMFSGGLTPDHITHASPLDYSKNRLDLNHPFQEIRLNSSAPIWGSFAGIGWEWANLAFLSGGIWMYFRRIINWHIPVSFLLSLSFFATLYWMMHPGESVTPTVHLLSGATMIGAFFIATDPVTAATSNIGKLYYGAAIGALVFVIRTWGGYPDGVAFAVLLMNMAAPYIDYYTKPRVFGQRTSQGD